MTPQTVTGRHVYAYVGIIVASAALTALTAQLAGGKVPLPSEWTWITPVLVAGLVALTTTLPRVTDTAQNSLAQAEQVAPNDPPPSPGKGFLPGTVLLPTVPPPPAPAPNAAPSTLTLNTSGAQLVTFPNTSATAAVPIPLPPEPPAPPA